MTTRLDVSPVYTAPSRREGRGRVPEGIEGAYFVMVDGALEVTTDPDEATHSFVRKSDGAMEVAAYRSDSTMILGEGRTVLAPVRVPLEP